MKKEDEWIGIVVPTKDGKYMIARATITDKDIETLSDCAIIVSNIDGVKSDLKYPFVLLSDVDKLRKKLIEDIRISEYELTKGLVHDARGKLICIDLTRAIENKINKRFVVKV